MGPGRLVNHLGDVTPGQYTLRCCAKDERGNMSKDDDSEHDYYAMDITKAPKRGADGRMGDAIDGADPLQ
jgi:hypothetical protein